MGVQIEDTKMNKPLIPRIIFLTYIQDTERTINALIFDGSLCLIDMNLQDVLKKGMEWNKKNSELLYKKYIGNFVTLYVL